MAIPILPFSRPGLSIKLAFSNRTLAIRFNRLSTLFFKSSADFNSFIPDSQFHYQIINNTKFSNQRNMTARKNWTDLDRFGQIRTKPDNSFCFCPRGQVIGGRERQIIAGWKTKGAGKIRYILPDWAGWNFYFISKSISALSLGKWIVTIPQIFSSDIVLYPCTIWFRRPIIFFAFSIGKPGSSLRTLFNASPIISRFLSIAFK